jgi:outer membrane immunogenic protein
MNRLHINLVASVSLFCIAATAALADDVSLQQVLKRLDALEAENQQLKKKIDRLEGGQTKNRIARTESTPPEKPTKENIEVKSGSHLGGPFVQVGLGYNHTRSTNTGIMDSNYASPSSATYFAGSDVIGNSVAVVIGAGYYANLSPAFMLGIGVDYSAVPEQTSRNALFNYRVYIDQVLRFRTKNRVSAYLSPAFLLADDKAIYAKLGISTQQIGLADLTKTYSQLGANIGLGYRQLFSPHIYGFVEGNYYYFAQREFLYFNSNTLDIVQINPSTNSFNIMAGFGLKY